MGFFNELMNRALETEDYICPECGAKMEFADDITLWCPKCGTEVDYDHYGFADEDEYDAAYPTREEVLGIGDDDEDDEEYEETYIDESEEYFRGFDD